MRLPQSPTFGCPCNGSRFLHRWRGVYRLHVLPVRSSGVVLPAPVPVGSLSPDCKVRSFVGSGAALLLMDVVADALRESFVKRSCAASNYEKGVVIFVEVLLLLVIISVVCGALAWGTAPDEHQNVRREGKE